MGDVLHVVFVAKVRWEQARDVAGGDESQTEGEVVWGVLVATLVEASEVRETDLLDVVGSSREFLADCVQSSVTGWWGTDVGEEVI